MKPAELVGSQIDYPRDEAIFVALVKRADALEVSVRRAERKLNDNAAIRADLVFALAVTGLLAALALAIAPNLELPHLAVPQVISYVCAFAVLFFAYLTYVAYGHAVAAHELRRSTRHAFEDGSSTLSRALCTLELARQEQNNLLPETRARVESTTQEAEYADARLHELDTQTSRDIEDLTQAHAGHRSSALAGIIGGVCGAVGGISIPASAAAVAVTGPLGAAVGVALAVLLWRGPAHWKVERAIERTQKALDFYYQELNRPQQDPPQDIRTNLWQRYDKLMSSYAVVVEGAVGRSETLHTSSPARGRATEGKLIMESSSA